MTNMENIGGYDTEGAELSVRQRALGEVASLARKFELDDEARSAVLDLVIRSLQQGRRMRNLDSPYVIVDTIKREDLGWLRNLQDNMGGNDD